MVTAPSAAVSYTHLVNILLPPMSEQKEISTYLDTKCSKIDHIIATQKKKIAYPRTETKPHYQRSDRQDKSKLTHKA